MTEAACPVAHPVPAEDPHPSSGSKFAGNLRSRVTRSRDRRVQLVLMLLEENPARQWRLEVFANLVNLSPGRLVHLFKSETGSTIQQYLTELRLDRAKRELELSFLSIKEIAAAVGFANVGRFSASFKASVGLTPCEYRKFVGSTLARKKNLALARSANR